MPSVKKSVIESLIERSYAIDKASRKKNQTEQEAQAVSAGALKFVRSVLSTLRKLK